MPTIRKQILDTIEARLVADGWFKTVTQDEEDYVLIEDPTQMPGVFIEGGGHEGEDSQGACSNYEMGITFSYVVCKKPLSTDLDEAYRRIVVQMKTPDRSIDTLARDVLEGELSAPEYEWEEGTMVSGEQQVEFTVSYETLGKNPSAQN